MRAVPGGEKAVARFPFPVARWLFLFTVGGFLLIRALSAFESYDFWWHLKTGEWIVQERTLPSMDPYSFASDNGPWMDHSWLFQVVMILLYRIGGFPALSLLKLGLLSGAVVALGLRLRRGGLTATSSGFLILACLWGACFRLTLRPDLVSVTFTVWLLFLLVEFRRTRKSCFLWMAGGILPLWANFHIGALLAPVLVVPFCLEPVLFPRAIGSRNGVITGPGVTQASSRPFWALLGWSFLALGLNPGGWHPYGVAFGLTRLTGQAFARNLEWGRPDWADFPLFYLSLIVLMALPAGFRKLPNPPVFAVTGLLAVMSLWSLRFLGIYYLTLPFFLAPYVAEVQTAVSRLAGGRNLRALVSGALVVGLGAGLYIHSLRSHPFRGDFLRRDRFPVGAVDFLAGKGIPAERLFNDVKFGGYLIWTRYPDEPVFIDGRNEVYPGLLKEIHAALGSAEGWKSLLRRYRIDSALLRYPPALSPVIYPGGDRTPPRKDLRPFSTLYFPREEWALVYWDDAAMLFLKREGKFAAILRETEYLSLRPDDSRHQLGRARREDPFRGEILAELQRKLREDPDCRRARRLYRVFSAAHPSGLTRSVIR